MTTHTKQACKHTNIQNNLKRQNTCGKAALCSVPGDFTQLNIKFAKSLKSTMQDIAHFDSNTVLLSIASIGF